MKASCNAYYYYFDNWNNNVIYPAKWMINLVWKIKKIKVNLSIKTDKKSYLKIKMYKNVF